MEPTKSKPMAEAHESYPDIMPDGMRTYKFARTRIEPIIYEVPDGSKVLDIGCNSGEMIKFLKENKKCDVYGLDISKPMVDLCHSKGLENVVLGNAETLPFPDKSFDVVILCETLEHFDEPVKNLKEIRRVLKDDGYLLGSCPHANLERFMWSDERLHHQYYDEEKLRKDLDTSFEVSHLRILNGAQFNIGWVNNHMAGLPCQFLFKCGVKKTKPWEEQKENSDSVRVYWGFTLLSGVVYYRMRGYADKMDKMGVESAYEFFNYDMKETQIRWQDNLTNKFITNDLEALMKVADLSIFQIFSNKMGLPFLMAAKEVIGKKIVTEVDDWLFDVPPYNVGSNPFRVNSDAEWMAYQQLEISDYLICSTQFIKEHLLEFFPGKEIFVVPNSIDFKIYDELNIDSKVYPKESGKIRIGFTGCTNHNGDLEIMKRPLRKILEEFPNVEFITYFKFEALKDLPNVIYTSKWTPIDKYPAEIRNWQMDIGIAPLRDNNFNRSKSNLRWLEYSGHRIPTIASKVYPFEKSIKDGETGVLCSSSELAWYEALKDLILNEEKRRAIGENAYNEVKEKFNMDIVAGEYAKILKELQCKGQTLRPKLADSSAIPIMTPGI